MSQTVGACAAGGMEALQRPETARVLDAANDDGDELSGRRSEARLGYGFALFDGRYTGTPELGVGLTETSRGYTLGWRLSEALRAGCVFGLDIEGVRNERAAGDREPEHRIGLGFGWRLNDTGRENFEIRLEGAWIDAA